MDLKTLNILGAPKEGFEWVKAPIATWDELWVGDMVWDGQGFVVVQVTSSPNYSMGYAVCRGEVYRQVPIEPEPKVIWGPSRGEGTIEYRILSSGELQLRAGNDPWKTSTVPAWNGGVKIAADYATQHKELKALKEKLGGIKAQADACASPSGYRANVMSDLIDMCRALEVE